VPTNSRIEELRRRVDKDPASIAFAQLAEEYRRTGQYEESVHVSRAGLTQHPGFVSARVTLGLSLMELGQYDEARATLESVVHAAPDNQAASRALAEISQRLGGAVPASLPTPANGANIHGTGRDAIEPALHELETWLAAIKTDRAIRERQR
jgi:predicted Zn-dependent protease